MTAPITRRTALRSLAGVAAVAALSRTRAAEAPTPAAMPTTDSFRHSACKWCYPKISLEDLSRQANDLGLSSIELVNPEDFPTLKKYGLVCAMVNFPTGKTPQGVSVGGITKAFNRLEHHDTLVELYTKQIAATADAGFENLICFSGNREKMDDQQGLENCASGLKRIMALAEKSKVTICMELLNSKVNHKDYMCDHTAWGVELCKRVNSPRVKLLYDIYHMQIMEGDIIRTIQQNLKYIGHFHTAGNPGRHQFDDTQELNYKGICRAIADLGYQGCLSHEYTPTKEPLETLDQMMSICEV